MNIGVIGIRGAWSTEMLAAKLAARHAGGAVIELAGMGVDLDSTTFYHHAQDLAAFDGFILKKMGREYSPHLLDELELLELMERRGFRFFSSPSRIRKMISRLACTVQLRDHGIPMPPVYVTESLEDGVAWVESNGPAVIKPLYSTKARGMALLTTPGETRAAIEAAFVRGERIIYLQKKVDIAGCDYGLVFLRGEYLGAYARVGDGSTWHTTTREGGAYRSFVAPQAFIDLAERAQSPFGLDFTCVDVADTRESGPIVFEVSAFGGYKGLHEATGIDASALVADHAIAALGGGV